MTGQKQEPHVLESLSAYLNEELEPTESQRVAEHLLRCRDCRNQYEVIRLGARAASRLPLYTAPENLWHDVQARLAEMPPDGTTQERHPTPAWGRAIAAMLVLGLVALSLLWQAEPEVHQRVLREEGTPEVAGVPFAGVSLIGIGQSLTTDATSRARIRIDGVGDVVVHPFSRVRLVQSSATEQRLALDVGRIEASILAPPRLFLVETPGALAVDLGCAYTLDVDKQGNGFLHVTSGWVGLEHGDREVLVPAGTACRINRSRGPGYPHRLDAGRSFLDTLFTLETDPGNPGDLASWLEEARPADALSLWYAFQDIPSEFRPPLLEAMMALAPPPNSIAPDALADLDADAWLRWRDHLEQLAAE